MIPRLFDKCLITPDDIKPSRDDFEVIGAFNPGVVEFDNTTYLLLRVAERPKEERKGYIALPRMEMAEDSQEIVIDWERTEDVDILDKRLVQLKSNGHLRLTYISHLRLAKSRDGIRIDSIDEKPTLFPQEDYEEFGIEDARITSFGDHCIITYVAASRHGIVTALASTNDFNRFERHGIIFPTENKDMVIFPEKINRQFAALHRPLSKAIFGRPEIWIAYSPDLRHWGNHKVVMSGNSYWDSMKIGASAPPVKLPDGWLEIYHGSSKKDQHDAVGVYRAGAVLFDLENPARVIARSKEPILIPEQEYECDGFLPDIIFPTGVVLRGDDLFIYSGTADMYTAVTKLSLNKVLDSL
ncbi:MAG: glycoside hydrolase family 130 protein [Thermodesulfobacteriota bacterium]